MRDLALSDRRVWVAAITGVLVGAALVMGVQWLTAAGAPVPSATLGTIATSATTEPTIGLPDHTRTPGAINPAATQANLATTVCKAGWAGSVRPPSAYTSALKIAQIVEYGYADKNPAHYQEDHLVPLELGGAPRDPRNLWPEPNSVTLSDGTVVTSGEKDDLEDALHAQVCAGTLELASAQRMIAGDWIAVWESLGQP